MGEAKASDQWMSSDAESQTRAASFATNKRKTPGWYSLINLASSRKMSSHCCFSCWHCSYPPTPALWLVCRDAAGWLTQPSSQPVDFLTPQSEHLPYAGNITTLLIKSSVIFTLGLGVCYEISQDFHSCSTITDTTQNQTFPNCQWHYPQPLTAASPAPEPQHKP